MLTTPRGVTPRPADRLVTAYRPSQPHGWPAGPGQEVGTTIGGHVPSRDFSAGGKRYRLGLLSFGQPGDAPDPVYEPEPADPEVGYRDALVDAFGDCYSFHFLGGLRGRERFHVQSYNVFLNDDWDVGPQMYGGELYVVFEPDTSGNGPAGTGPLLWIRVVQHVGGARPSPGSYVDNIGGTNPFTPTGGRTSIYGNRLINLDYFDRTDGLPQGPERFVAEVFLVRDTRLRDASGRDVITVLGGLKYGWQVEELG
jgi:hypothetical protein